MNKPLSSCLRAVLPALVLAAMPARAECAEPPAAGIADASAIRAEFQDIQSRIKAKIAAGRKTAADLAPEMAELDALLGRLGNDEEAAKIAYAKATLYARVIGDQDKARELLKEIGERYAGTKMAKDVSRQLAAPASNGPSAAEAAIVGKPAPELNFEWASVEGVKKLSDLKGRVVVLDFWATWCGPCISSFPEVRKHVAHFANSPVTVLGVTSVQGSIITKDRKRIDFQGEPQKEIAMLAEVKRDHDMTWPIAVSRENVFNPDYGIGGIPHVAIIAPDGTVRENGLHPKGDSAKIEEVVTALLKEFKL